MLIIAPQAIISKNFRKGNYMTRYQKKKGADEERPHIFSIAKARRERREAGKRFDKWIQKEIDDAAKKMLDIDLWAFNEHDVVLSYLPQEWRDAASPTEEK